ncbi:Methylesterase 2 [Nymphaea thermarum]|nr:Methylesterase 2 [Nymphaea thermarum]
MVSMGEKKKHHFVMVHGSTMGGWCWFKVASLLREGGHKVSALDLRASGLDPATADQVATFADYTHPLIRLLHSIPADERVVLVGHSFGGLSISLAAEMFPAKVSAAVFIAAFMPQLSKSPTDVLYQYFFAQKDRIESWEDSVFTFKEDASQMFPDYTLAIMLKRPAPFYREDLSSQNLLSEENYGRTKKAYIVCKDDQLMKESFQRWMIEMSPVDEVLEIEDSDHMAMLSRPLDLCHHLLHIAETHCSRKPSTNQTRDQREREMDEKKQHFVLVHGSCHGAWCWFKLAPLLRMAGHEVSVFDLKASGIHPAMPDQVVSVADYSQPLLDLLDSIAADERVVLVGHSFGGLSIALAADKFPAKVSVAVFLAAFMPQPSIPPSHILHNV